jgi:hypothetical protein
LIDEILISSSFALMVLYVQQKCLPVRVYLSLAAVVALVHVLEVAGV